MTTAATTRAPQMLAPTAAPAGVPHAPIVVRVEGLGKRFKIYRRPIDRVLEWLGAGKRHSEHWAVRGVNFEVERGGCLGIIGANGSGKSTLLKMISRALHPTEGSFRVEGRVLSLIELGTGLNQHLTGRANVYNAAALLGFPANFARDKIKEIEAFADLGEFFDRPVILYSTGMRVRLAFSMFACFRPEVLIVDEALSVGDVFFQQKCATRIQELLNDGMTMIFVSHDQSAVLNLCDRAILLEKGAVTFSGDPAEALHRYTASLSKQPRFAPRKAVEPAPASAAPAVLKGDVLGERKHDQIGNGDVRVLAVRVADRMNRDTLQAMMGETLRFEVLVEAVRPVHQPRVGMHFYDRFGNLAFAAGTYQLGHELPDLAPGDRLIVRAEVTLDLHPGEYTFGVGASIPSDENPEHGIVCDRVMQLGPVAVVQDRSKPRPFFGMAKLPMRVTHSRGGGAA